MDGMASGFWWCIDSDEIDQLWNFEPVRRKLSTPRMLTVAAFAEQQQ
jgi:hypothetical protein